ncbi:methionine--tRNA ligase [Candidatus Poribacteria bacterium]|nr:methionine--tRNA ligase [Candidatus Poribacteria bacterium]
MENKKKFYLTTPLYYVNDEPHVGHAYTNIASDTLARYRHLLGDDVFFLTGTDEHGQKIERVAQKNNETPQELADRLVKVFKNLWQELNISNDDFIRTTETRHTKTVKAIFEKIFAKGDIYKGFYEGWYCTPCETFWTETQLINNRCPDCNRDVERLQEQSYFFKMSKYAEPLLKYIDENPYFIEPVSRRTEVINFVQGGLKDLSISRTSFKWGIQVPNDSEHVIYVWFDALLNYISASGYLEDPEKFASTWPCDVHIIGKDILKFHAVIWPCILLAADIPLPKKVFAHGWWTVEGKKMSKSIGNVVKPFEMVKKYGTDAFRYFLLREVTFGLDGDFSETALIQRFNSDLANDLGNLLHRTLNMVEKYCEGIVPINYAINENIDKELIEKATSLAANIPEYIAHLSFSELLVKIWEIINKANKYIEMTAPYSLAKKPECRERLFTIMYNLLETLRILSVLIYPFMPDTAMKMRQQLGIDKMFSEANIKEISTWGLMSSGSRINKLGPLFPRIEIEKKV